MTRRCSGRESERRRGVVLCGVVLLVPQDVPLVFLLPRAVFISSLSTLFAPVAPHIDAAAGVHAPFTVMCS